MKIISFAWTTPALLAGRKTVTRRDWNDGYAQRFRKGDLVQAYDRSPRYGGRRVAVIRLTVDPYKELTNDVPATDWEAEGFAYLTEIGATPGGRTPDDVWDSWRDDPTDLWVVHFELVEVTAQKPAESSQRSLFEQESLAQ